jgi:hypothetical protein
VANTSGRVPAVAAVALAALLGGGWLLFGDGWKVRWQVARGAPPASADDSRLAAEALGAMGVGAREHLLAILRDRSTSRARKAWVAAVLLRSPFFAQALVEKEVASDHPPTARAAVFALMGGEEPPESFQSSVAEASRSSPGMAAPVETWDARLGIPVLVEWLARRDDPEAALAALLLAQVPHGDPRVRDALLAVVDEVPDLFAEPEPAGAKARRRTVVHCLQALLAWARDDEAVAGRVARQVAWLLEHAPLAEDGGIQYYGVWLFEVARGRGVDPSLLKSLAGSADPRVRQRLAHTLETVKGAGAGEALASLLGDESSIVRRAALYTLRKREDPLLYDLLPVLVEDANPYVRAEALKFAGELKHVAPGRAREAVPILVEALEEPWPGDPPPTGSPYGLQLRGATVDAVAFTLLALYRITGNSSGLPREVLFDQAKLDEKARSLVEDPKARAAVVAEWRSAVPPRAGERRARALAANLAHRDMDNVLRAARELFRMTGDPGGIPPKILEPADDDAANRDAIRELVRSGKWAEIVAGWRKRVGGE